MRLIILLIRCIECGMSLITLLIWVSWLVEHFKLQFNFFNVQPMYYYLFCKYSLSKVVLFFYDYPLLMKHIEGNRCILMQQIAALVIAKLMYRCI